MTALESLTQRPLVSFAREGIPPPSPLYITPDDGLFVVVTNSAASQTVTLLGRILLPGGEVQTFQEVLTVVATRAIEEFRLPLTEGFLLNITAFPGVNTRKGQTYLRISMIRGSLAAGTVHATMVQDYVYTGHFPSWPVINQPHLVDGRGVIRAVTGTDPAAGANIVETVPTNARWRLLAIDTTLVTSAVVGTRRPRLTFSNGTAFFISVPQPGTQTASLTVTWRWAVGSFVTTEISAAARFQGIPDLLLPEGFTIETRHEASDAGDNWGAPTLLVEEWIEY